MIRAGGAMVFFFLENKLMKKWFVQQSEKIKKFVYKTGKKMELYAGKNFACSFA